jgi:small subunit ribosomal protein S17
MQNISEKKQSRIQVLKGKIISSRNHCAIVAVERIVKHPKYGKYIQRRKKYKAHDAADSRETGEIVPIVPCRPISKDKRFRVVGKSEAQNPKSETNSNYQNPNDKIF